MVLAKLLDYASEKQLTAITKKAAEHNRQLEKAVAALKSEMTGLEQRLQTIKAKKEKYLNSLISKQFSTSERKAINGQIEDFSLTEKQTQSDIYKAQLEIATKQDAMVPIDQFKEQIIHFKLNQDAMDAAQLGGWLKANVKAVTFKGSDADIAFTLLGL